MVKCKALWNGQEFHRFCSQLIFILNVNNREVAAEVHGQHQLVFLSFPKVESEQAYGHLFYVEDADTSTYFRLTCFVCETFTLTSSTTTSSIVMNGSIGFSGSA